MCIYEYNTYQKRRARAFYQVLTTTSAGGGYWEQFMGTEGAIRMSENPALTKIFKENGKELINKGGEIVEGMDLELKWANHIAKGHLTKGAAVAATTAIADARESKQLDEYQMNAPEDANRPIHSYHLENFFNTVRGKETLNCDSEHAFEAEAAVFKVNEAIEAKKMLMFTEVDFVA